MSVTHLTGTPVLAWANPVEAQQQDHQEHHPTTTEQAEMQKQEAHTMQMHQKMMAEMKACMPCANSKRDARPGGQRRRGETCRRFFRSNPEKSARRGALCVSVRDLVS